MIYGVNQRPVSKSIFTNLITVLSITNSDIDSSRSHPNYDWHRPKRIRPFNDLVLLVFERPLAGHDFGGGEGGGHTPFQNYWMGAWPLLAPPAPMPMLNALRNVYIKLGQIRNDQVLEAPMTRPLSIPRFDPLPQILANFLRQCIIFTFCNIRTVWLHQIVRRWAFTFPWLFWVQLVTNSDSQIAEVIARNPSFYDGFKQDT